MDQNLTEIIFILDRSGSMGGLESDTIGGYNAFIDKQLEEEGRTLVTTVLFDDKYEVLWSGIEAKEAKLDNRSYYVRGTTALLDAIGKTIIDTGHRLYLTEEQKRPSKVICVITTDGMENASCEFSYEKVKRMIQHQQEKYNWDFIFLGANIDVAKMADHIGIDRQDAYSYTSTPEGIHEMYTKADMGVKSKRKKNL